MCNILSQQAVAYVPVVGGTACIVILSWCCLYW